MGHWAWGIGHWALGMGHGAWAVVILPPPLLHSPSTQRALFANLNANHK
ncbi:hypothetical protein [aff. Roholtiella sp. LEGE 12411]|nr:hypothetical protein [aff. Roholtiella sp. LEGE 12411]